MFGKKRCQNCKEKVSKKYDFCPYCGSSLKKTHLKDIEDYGMLGIDDKIDLEDNFFGNRILNNNFLNKVLGNAVKMLEKELEKEFKNANPNQNIPQRTGFEIIINGKRIDPKNIRFGQGMLKQEKPKKARKTIPKMSSESLKKISGLKKHEPSTNIRRLANKIIYEIDIPGVKSTEDISITKLENGIEIKALAQETNKAYSKTIPIDLPIIDYELRNGKLILELDVKN